MKKRLLLIFSVILNITLFSQDIDFDLAVTNNKKIEIGGTNYEITIYNDNYSFESADYYVYPKNSNIIIETKGVVNDSIIISIDEIPDNHEIICLNKFDVYTNKKRLIGSFELNITGKKPIIKKVYNSDKPEASEIVIGDPTESLYTIEGENLSSLDLKSLNIPELTISNISMQNGKINFEAISNETNIKKDISIHYTYEEFKNGSFDPKHDKKKILFYTRIATTGFLEFQPSYIYEYDINTNLLTFKIKSSSELTGNYTIESNNSSSLSTRLIINDENDKAATLKLLLNPTEVKIGSNTITLSKSSSNKFSGRFIIKANPKITSVIGGLNNSLSYNPFISSQELIIKGENLEDLTLKFGSRFIKFVEKGIDRNYERKYSLIFNDSIQEGDYDFELFRGGFSHKGIIIISKTPRKYNVEKYIKINDTSIENKDNFTFSVTDEVEFTFAEDNIPKEFGNQSLKITLYYYDENGNLLHVKEKDKSGNLEIVTQCSSTTTNTVKNWGFKINYKGQENDKQYITPWGYVIVRITYSSDYYLARDDNIISIPPYKLIFEGKEGDLWHVSLSIPPALFAFGGKGNGLIGQFLPANFGIGIVRDFRKKESNELSKWDIGLYVAGLNFASPSNSNIGLASNSIDSTLLVQNADISVMILTQFHFSKTNRSWAIPIGFGVIPPFIEEKTKFFLTFGVTYTFGKD